MRNIIRIVMFVIWGLYFVIVLKNTIPYTISLRSMAVLSSRAQERRSREIRARIARERAAKPREK